VLGDKLNAISYSGNNGRAAILNNTNGANVIYTAGNADGTDTFFCFDAETGKTLWKHSYPAELGDKYFEGGPSATRFG